MSQQRKTIVARTEHRLISPHGEAAYRQQGPRLLEQLMVPRIRVLHEAGDPRTPLLERLKFLAIVGSNLDKFFMKRIGGLKQQVEAGITETEAMEEKMWKSHRGPSRPIFGEAWGVCCTIA